MYQDLDFTDNNYYREDYIDSPVDDFDWMPNLFAKLANHLRTSTSPTLSDWESSAASETMSREIIHFSNGMIWKPCVAI